MAQTLEAIRGGGGSIKVGTIGTVSALMSRELDSTKSAAANVPSVDEASSSSSSTSNFKNHKGPENTRRTKNHTQSTHQIPILKSGDISIDGTPIRQKPIKKGPGIVNIVDIKCGNSDKMWAKPIKHRLKKLGFSKLSHSIV